MNLSTEKNVISAIEDWVDMVPDLKILSKLQQSLSDESDKLASLDSISLGVNVGIVNMPMSSS